MNAITNKQLLTTLRRPALGKTATLVAALAVLPCTAGAQPVLLDDVYFTGAVRSNTDSLDVQGAGTKTSYLRFRPGMGLPEGITAANIAKATLKLYVQRVSHAGAFTVQSVLPRPAWTEKGATGVPALGAGISAPVTVVPKLKNE